MNTALIDAALSWAKKGVPVFPCGSNKAPMTENGHLNASVDPMKVRAMFEFAGDDALIGARMGAESKLFACDFDLYKEGAKEYMESLAERGLLTATQVHLTRSGGLHFIYRSDTAYPNCKPHPGVEIKGEGGYVIVPPSPGYSIQQKGIAYASEDLITELVAARRTASKSTVDQLSARILSADDFHDSLAALAARLSARGLSQAQVQRSLIDTLSASVASATTHPRHERWRSLMKDTGGELYRLSSTSHEKYNPHVAGENAREAADAGLIDNLVSGSAGFFSRGPASDAGGDSPDLEKVIASIVPPTGEWPFEKEGYFSSDDREILDQRYIMYPLFAERETVLMAAEPKAGKTAISLRLAMAVALGESVGTGPHSLAVTEPRPVLYFTLEGARAVEMRVAAERGRRKDAGQSWPERKDDRLFIVDRPQNLLADKAQIEFCAKVIAHDRKCKEVYDSNLGLVFIDTLTKAMPGGDQNSVEDTSQLFKITDTLREYGVTATIVFIHHLSKQGEVRGSTNIEAEVDVVTSVEKTKTPGLVRLIIRRARSIDESVAYSFRLSSYYLGETVQGHRLAAPVVDMVTAEDNSALAEGARAAQKWATLCNGLITGLGLGKHNAEKLMQALSAGNFIDVGTARRPSPAGAAIQKQMQALFDGKHNWSFGDYWFGMTREADAITGLEIRDSR
jgi:AAA domain/Bifunctional DNA primase/polymerase, N-terminal